MILRSASAASCALLLAACGSEPTSIEGLDRCTYFPAIEASWSKAPPELEGPGGRVTGALALDLAAWTGSGHDALELDPSDHVAFDDRDFFGPARLDLDWRVTDVTVAGRAGGWLGRRLRAEAIFGFELESIELDVADVSDRRIEVGPCLGAQATIRIFDRLSIQGRWQEYLSLFGNGWDGIAEGRGEQWRAGLVCEATSSLELFGGWSWWKYVREAPSSESDVRLKLSGPMVALRFRL